MKSNLAIFGSFSIPCSIDSNCSLPELPLPAFRTSSIRSCAFTSPSRIWALDSAFSRSKTALLSMISSLCSTYVCSITGRESRTGLPSSIPIILAEYDSCNLLDLNSWFSTACGSELFFTSITTRIPSFDDSSRMSLIPVTASFDTNSAIWTSMSDFLTWYGIS